MNKKLVVAGIAAIALAFGASARPHGPGFGHHGFGPGPRGPAFHHHHHHGGYWGRGGRNFWPGFVGGIVGGAIYDAVTYPRYYGYGGVVVAPAPTVVTTPPVVVQQPAPVVVQQPAPVVVQQPVAQNVWVEGRYVDQVQANGTVVRVWQPGHYVQSTAVVQ